MAAKATTKTTTINTSPAKAPRVRKPKLVDHPVDRELEEAVEDLDVSDAEAAAVSKLGLVDFFLDPHILVTIGEDGSLTLSPYDAAHPGNAGLRGISFAVDILGGAPPAYRFDHATTTDLRYLLAKHLKPTLEQEADRLHRITIEDLERENRRLRAENAKFIAEFNTAFVNDIVAAVPLNFANAVDGNGNPVGWEGE